MMVLGQMEGDSPLPRTNSKLSGSTTRVPWRGGGTCANGSTRAEVSAGVPRRRGSCGAPCPAGGDEAAWPEAVALPTGSRQGQRHRSRASHCTLHSPGAAGRAPSQGHGALRWAAGSEVLPGTCSPQTCAHRAAGEQTSTKVIDGSLWKTLITEL